MRAVIAAAVATVLSLGTSACGLLSPELDPANMIGVVYSIDDTTPTDVHPSRIWLEDILHPQPRAHPPGSAGIGIWKGTDIFIRYSDGTLVRGDFGSVALGDTVSVWHTNVEMRSLPPQYNATRVEVLHGGPAV